MPTISLQVRYQRHAPDKGEEYIEANFRRAFLDWTLDPAEAALVMVDCWNIHPIATHQERAARICAELIAPVAAACRHAGVCVVHAPSPGQAKLYPQSTKFASDAELFGAGGEPPAWPPAEFRNKEGDYAQFARPEEPATKAWIEAELANRRIIDCLEPRPEDFVVATGEQLHRLCRYNGVVHLFYCGFAANMCVPGRDYGMRAMQRRGYNVILLRDCTTAIEVSHTHESLA
ncbi:MAG: cysteine hydrolase family protein, partial [Armatimonadota bacterium]